MINSVQRPDTRNPLWSEQPLAPDLRKISSLGLEFQVVDLPGCDPPWVSRMKQKLHRPFSHLLGSVLLYIPYLPFHKLHHFCAVLDPLVPVLGGGRHGLQQQFRIRGLSGISLPRRERILPVLQGEWTMAELVEQWQTRRTLLHVQR